MYRRSQRDVDLPPQRTDELLDVVGALLLEARHRRLEDLLACCGRARRQLAALPEDEPELVHKIGGRVEGCVGGVLTALLRSLVHKRLQRGDVRVGLVLEAGGVAVALRLDARHLEVIVRRDAMHRGAGAGAGAGAGTCDAPGTLVGLGCVGIGLAERSGCSASGHTILKMNLSQRCDDLVPPPKRSTSPSASGMSGGEFSTRLGFAIIFCGISPLPPFTNVKLLHGPRETARRAPLAVPTPSGPSGAASDWSRMARFDRDPAQERRESSVTTGYLEHLECSR